MGELLQEIGNHEECKTIIFAETKRKVDTITRTIQKQGWNSVCIHGDKTQQERDWALKEFRGINFAYPNNSEDYVHRIGRTGRASQTGTAYTFFTSNNSKQAHDLVEV